MNSRAPQNLNLSTAEDVWPTEFHVSGTWQQLLLESDRARNCSVAEG